MGQADAYAEVTHSHYSNPHSIDCGLNMPGTVMGFYAKYFGRGFVNRSWLELPLGYLESDALLSKLHISTEAWHSNALSIRHVASF